MIETKTGTEAFAVVRCRVSVNLSIIIGVLNIDIAVDSSLCFFAGAIDASPDSGLTCELV